MAHHELMATFPTIELAGGYQLVLEPIDPATGSGVGGVSVSAVAIYASGNIGRAGGLVELPQGDFSWLPVPVTAVDVLDTRAG